MDYATTGLLVFSALASIGGAGVLVSWFLSWWRRPEFTVQFAHGAKSIQCQRGTQRVLDIEVVSKARSGVETKTIFMYFPHALGLTNAETKGVPSITILPVSSGRFANHDYFGIANFSFLPGEAAMARVTLNFLNEGGRHAVTCSVHLVSGVPQVHELTVEII